MQFVEFIRDGGFGAIIVLLFLVITLIGAGAFAWRPDRRKLAQWLAQTNVRWVETDMPELASVTP